MTNRTLRTLEEHLEEPRPEAWRPEPGDPPLIGELREVRWLTSSFDSRRYPMLVIAAEPDGRLLALHALHSVLEEELRLNRPQVGERLGIKRLGRVQGKGAAYEHWKVAVDREEPADPWGDEAERPAGEPEDIPY